MSLNLSSIKKILSGEGGVIFHRQVFILAGNDAWQKELLKDILLGHESDSLWVGEQDPELLPFISAKKAHSWLGKEKRVVIFDANNDFDPDSFAAISGIVVGGGLFFLLLPATDKWNDVYSSYFGQRIIQSINSRPELIIIKETDKEFHFHPNKPNPLPQQNCIAPFLTADQQSAVESIAEQVINNSNNPVVLLSDRGRGKSAALGFVAARLLHVGIKKIAITAPRLRATDIIFKHIAETLAGAEISRGRVKYGESIIQFYSPDQLLQENIEADLLLVDEAAAIPVPQLTSFLHNYSQCVFASTIHGYEGTGRGFALRFFKVLEKRNPGWLRLRMETPIRWAENDPLENWMFKLLCLDAEIVDVSAFVKLEENMLEHHLLKKEHLVANAELLNEVFSLLVIAHYRTRPNDLKNLLDDDDLSLYVTLHKKNVIAVALVVCEGRFSDALATAVYRGERRPSGNLLAQALTYHCGIEHAATLDYARIMRIAVHPELQQQGIGSSLLDYIVNNERYRGRDAIGTSFGINESLLNFWRKSNFDVVRIGFTREQTSGEHAAIMLLPLTDEGETVYQLAHTQFIEKCPYWFSDVLKDLPREIKTIFQSEINKSSALNDFDKEELNSFVQYSRNYELCIAALNKFVLKKYDEIKQESFPDNFRKVLTEKVINKSSWKDIGNAMALSGQNEARKLFHSAVVFLIER